MRASCAQLVGPAEGPVIDSPPRPVADGAVVKAGPAGITLATESGRELAPLRETCLGGLPAPRRGGRGRERLHWIKT
ncbi:Hypothetical predicted protein [Podarcis lilfordi]|uniref:Uncharacterized protein n=1 Tax=Podarcis lilfordi TaxID=74358 RepID=A0AA35PCU7_9SAUR|nr:Hypothetical predicted protein [Podarcis lilfordi]